ncbi:MAG: hypothetical protein G8345_09055 [Magnetococcales bacterium]|nr:hypothetical protein [Magnetococcales bacterium]NGZ27024.1 hypothetical protein [Magnetococcales bacterium]
MWQRFFSPPAGRSLLYHAATPLSMITPDGSGQVTHPDILYFAHGWRGYPYWMVITPYPFMDESEENPCIFTSMDGLAWQIPPGNNNPLVMTPERGFHADPDLLYHPQLDELWLYYLHTVRHEGQWLKRLRSDDGCHWQSAESILRVDYHQIRSPALLWWRGKIWLWSVNMTLGRRLEVRHSNDGFHWTPPQTVYCSLPNHTPSHVDVMALGEDGPLAMVIQATPKAGGANPLFFRISEDGLHWQGGNAPLLAAEDGPLWSRQTLYRATMAPWKGHYGLWYGGRAGGGINHMAMTPFALKNYVPERVPPCPPL